MIFYICNLQINGYITARQSRPKSSLNAELRLLIHGTKNAYTTIQSGDIVIYELESPNTITGANKGLGLFTDDSMILPLCIRNKMADEFFINQTLGMLCMYVCMCMCVVIY